MSTWLEGKSNWLQNMLQGSVTFLLEVIGAQADVMHKGVPVRGTFQSRPMVTSSCAFSLRDLRLETSMLVKRSFFCLHRQCSGHVLFIQVPSHTRSAMRRGPVSDHVKTGCDMGDKVARKSRSHILRTGASGQQLSKSANPTISKEADPPSAHTRQALADVRFCTGKPPRSVKSRARAAVVLFHLEPNRVQVSHVGLHTHFLAFKGTSVPEFFLNIVQQWSMLKSMQSQSPGAQNCSKQQQAKQVTPFTNLKVSAANVVADSRSEL